MPAFRHRQQDILQFMQLIYSYTEADKRRLRFLYHQSAIDTQLFCYTRLQPPCPGMEVLPTYRKSWSHFPSLEQRMIWYNKYAPQLSVNAIRDCLDGKINEADITHLITVSCTGMSAPRPRSAGDGSARSAPAHGPHFNKLYGLLRSHSCTESRRRYLPNR